MEEGTTTCSFPLLKCSPYRESCTYMVPTRTCIRVVRFRKRSIASFAISIEELGIKTRLESRTSFRLQPRT
jgi:hypothetical protein